MPAKRANFVLGTVLTAPSPATSGTTLTLSAGTGALFPTIPVGDWVICTIYPNGQIPLASNAEIVRVTAVVGDVITIQRNAEPGGILRAIQVGDQISNTITAGYADDVDAAIALRLTAINVSAGVTSNNLSALTFSNSNGVSFGLTGSVLTATVATNYQSQGAYLTTAALSQDSSKYAGTNGAITGGSITVNTSGVSVNLPAYLTTGMASNRGTDFVQATAVFAGTNASGTIASGAISVSVGAPGAASFNISAGTTSNNTTALRFADSNGVSFGLNAGTITATVKTDYQTSGAYLTTAMQSNAATISNVRVSGGTTSNLLSAITFADGNGVSFGLNASTLTATVRTDYQSSGAYLTTAMASNRGSDFVQATAAFAGTNASGTIASDGISVSVAPPSAANFNVSAGTTSNDTTALAFADSNGVSFGLNAGTLTATVKTDYQTSGAYLTTAMQSNAVTLSNVRVSAGTTSNLLSALTFSNSNGLAFGLDAGTITGSYTVPTVPAQTNQTVGLYASSNTTLTSSGTFDARSFSVRAIGSLTAGYSGGELLLSAPLALTTAMASNRGSDFVQATAAFAGTNASGTINSTGISVSVANAVAQSNQTIGLYASSNTYLTSSGTVDARSLTFRGDKSITVGISNSEVLFSVGAYLTTAALSQDSSKYAGTNGAITGGSITVNTSGVSVNLPAYLTTADLSANSSKYVQEWALTGNTAGTTSSAQGTRLYFSGGNSLTISGSSNSIVFSVGNYLTTAMASNRGSDFVQATAAFAGTNANGTINSTGISVSVAAQTNQSAIKGFGVSNTGQTAGNTGISTGIDWVLAGSNSITLSQSTAVGGPNTVWIQHPAWITTARASTDAIGLNTAKTNVTWTVNSSGLSFDAGGYAGTGFTSTTTAGTAIVGTNNTAGLSVGVPNYLTTAMASNRGSDFVAATAAFAGTNASGTIASDGISVSVAAPGAAAENNWITLTGNVSGNSSASGSTIAWSGGNGVTLSGTNNSVIGISVATFDTVGTATTVYSVASANSVGTITRWAAEDHRHAGIGGLGISTSGNTAGTTGSNVGSYWLEGGNNITVSQITSNNGSHTIVIAGGGAAALSPLSYYLNIDNYAGMATGASAITQTSGSSIFVQPFTVGNDISASYLRLLASFNDSAVGTAGTPVVNSTFSVERYTTIGVVLYSQGTGANSRSIQYVTSTSAGLTGQTNCGAGAQSSRYTITLAKTYPATGVSNNNWTTSYAVSSASIVVSSNSNTLFTGPRYLDIPFAQSIAPGNYWMGIGASTSSASQSGNISAIGTAGMAVSLNAISQIAMSFGPLGVATSASDHQMQLGVGVWTTNASNWSTSSIALSQISQLASNPQLPFQMIRQV